MPEPDDDLLQGLPPVIGDDARILILGSMPGVRSLDETRYYAHPRNAFWPIVGDLLGLAPGLPYEKRLEAMVRHRIGLWDVIGRCRRPGSLDARIHAGSIEVNDLPGILRSRRRLRLIAFNGGRAEQEFSRRVLPDLGEAARAIERVRLPSTSPAHAAMSLDEKRRQWRAALAPLLRLA